MRELVGRERETARLRVFVGKLGGGPSALVIEGEPGIGKTALWEATVALAAEALVLQARCADPEAGLAYAGLGDVLGGMTEPVLGGLPWPQRRTLDVVLGRAEVGRDPVEPQVVGRATLAVLKALAASAPVLVAVDDVQWLDAASARALAFAVRRLGPLAPVGVLVTKRGVSGPLPLGLDEALLPERRERLLVGPLDPHDLELLVEERLASPLSRALRRRVAAVAGGNPLYALELAAAQRLTGRPQENLLGLPAQLEELLADRLGRLPTEATEPLGGVASLANPTVALINGVLGAPAGTGLDAAMDAGVLLVDEGRLRFSHPLLAVAASARLAPSARRKLHARLAATLTDPEERARHLVVAADGPDAAVAAAVEQGADRARARGAPEVAAELAEAAVRLTPPEQVKELRRRRIAAGYHRLAAGEISRGRAHLATALAEAPPGPVQTDLRWRLGMLLLSDGDLGRAVELLEAALAESRGDQALHAVVARRLAGMYYWQGRFGEAVRLMRLAVELAQALGDPRAQLDALTMGVFAFLMAGELPEDLPARLEQLAGAAGPLQPHEDPQLGLAMVDLANGDAASAASRLQEVYRRAVDEGDELALAVVPAQLAQVELARGRWQQAQGWAEEALRTTKRLARPFALAQGLLAAATVDAHLGNAEAARAAAAELVKEAERTGLVPLALEGRAVLGFVALSQGDARAAHAELSPVLERLTDLGVREPIVVRLIWTELDALVELGELDQAAALASELEARGRALDRPFALVTAARAHGRIHAARGDLDAALARLEQALGQHDRLGWPFERARTQLALGMVLRRGKHKRAARQALEESALVFEQLGARLWSAKAEAELARIGGRPPRTGGLTPTERRVAELVAQGHTNREVADLLFLSVKTVAAHLTSAYAKLGVRSRTELAHRLHASATDDATVR